MQSLKEIQLINRCSLLPVRCYLFGLGCSLLLIGVAACAPSAKQTDDLEAKLEETQMEISRGVVLLYSDSAKVKSRLTTPLYIQYKTAKPYDEMPEGLMVEFFDKDSVLVESTLTANYGIRHLAEKNIEVRDSVVVINKKGEKLNTERLVWDEVKRIIYSDKFVKITTTDKIIEGYGLEANEDLTNYKITKMSGVVYIDKPLGE